jgi:hypothetical protein
VCAVCCDQSDEIRILVVGKLGLFRKQMGDSFAPYLVPAVHQLATIAFEGAAPDSELSAVCMTVRG